MTKKKIIALVGMAGAGKSEAVNFLQKKYHWQKLYFGDIIFDEIRKKGLSINQKNERMIREKIRQDFGMGACAILSLPKIKELLKKENYILIESLYSWDEYKILKEKYKENFIVIAIVTPRKLRFNRLKNRKYRPLKTLKEFNQRDWTEIEGTDKGGPIAIADWTIINDLSLKNLHNKLEEIINLI